MVSLRIAIVSRKEKECFGLLGESGCGKTSLLTAALGFFQISHRYKDAKIQQDWVVPAQTEYFDKDAWNKTVSGGVWLTDKVSRNLGG